MGRFENSFALAKASWRVLCEDKQLTLLPLLSMVSTVVVAVSFLLPISLIARNGTDGYTASKPLVWVLGFCAYLVLTFVVVFFNAALVYAADRHLAGERVTPGVAIQAARARSHVLLPWVVVSATVSIVLRAVEERAGVLGRIVGTIAGVAWSVVTFLVLPILVIEGIGPIAAVKRSGELFKRTWGENLMTNAGIGIVALVATLAGAIPLVLLIMVGGPIAVVGVVALVLWVIAVSLVSATLTGILQVALYRFATEAQVPGFDTDELRGTFRTRTRRGLWN
jgi:uncharacterized protein DUF6159